jgi:hypothetical protein
LFTAQLECQKTLALNVSQTPFLTTYTAHT